MLYAASFVPYTKKLSCGANFHYLRDLPLNFKNFQPGDKMFGCLVVCMHKATYS